jgi:protein required for attachment to host cells
MFLRRKGMLWLVVADGRTARVFAQPDRVSPIALVSETAMVNGEPARERPFRVHDSKGRRHGLSEASARAADHESRFLGGIAELINRSAEHDDFEHLVLVAPARAMGVLRQTLDPRAARRVRAEFVTDMTGASEHELGAWLSSVEPDARSGARSPAS